MLSYFEIREGLSRHLASSGEIFLLTAYVKRSAIEWAQELAQDGAKVTLVSRFSCADIQAGSTDIEVIRLALDSNWSVKSLPSLHAKVFLFDKTSLIVGSANLTSNGLLLSGSGNLEAAIELNASESDVEFVNHVVDSAQDISYEVLERMESHLNSSIKSKPENTFGEWPEDLFPESGKVWVSDFLWLTDKAEIPQEINKVDFKNCKAFQWLKRTLKSGNNDGLRYGELTKNLHDDLCDDPAPYRSSVKELLSGVIEYAELYAQSEISVSRPGYSQVLKLR